MMTPAQLDRALTLLKERARLRTATWTVRTCDGNVAQSEPLDAQLATALEDYRGRRIAPIDQELADLGVDPSST